MPTFFRVLCAALTALACAGCQTRITPPRSAPTRYDIWTTPAPGEDAPRLARVRAPSTPRTIMPAGWSADAEVTFVNRYVWRGQVLSDGAVFQPAANLRYRDFRLGVWANFDLSDAIGNKGEFNEVDVVLDWSRVFDKARVPFKLAAGAFLYFFPNTRFPTTSELYASAGLVIPTNPTLTVYRDIDEIDGWYGSFHLEDGVSCGDFRLEGKVGIGWGSRNYDRIYFGVDESGLNDFHAFLSLPWKRSRWMIKPFVGWQALVDGALRRSTARDDALVYGLTVSATL